MRERDIERYLVKRVKALGGEVRKVKWIGRNGAPDRLVMLPLFEKAGDITRRLPLRSAWVELKATGKSLEAHQLREHKRMALMGQRVETIDSIELVDELLGAM